MTRSIELSTEQRNDLLARYRKDPDPEVRFRSHWTSPRMTGAGLGA